MLALEALNPEMEGIKLAVREYCDSKNNEVDSNWAECHSEPHSRCFDTW